ncbi:MAG: sugar-binding transcriptional regulator [Actinobacteria bacterium]|nr:sugar-binding transcriptional regulator [Actinomycetota bacterium]
MPYDIDLMIKVCNLYYINHLTQNEIAERLKISRYQVSRMIDKALVDGIVKITIADAPSKFSSLNRELEERFKLKRAIVIDDPGLSNNDLKARLGTAAASYLQEIIKDGDVIGVSWGTTVNEMVKALPPKINRRVEVVQITGGSHQLSMDLNCHDVARRLAVKFGVEPHLLYAPALVDSKEMRDLLIKDSNIKRTFDYFENITIALVGIGTLSPKIHSTLVESGHLSERDVKILLEAGAVGDIFSRFFDINGNICDTELNDRVIAMSPDQLMKVPYRVGIAGGSHKALAILGAIMGELVNILLTDSTTAEEILRISSK